MFKIIIVDMKIIGLRQVKVARERRHLCSSGSIQADNHDEIFISRVFTNELKLLYVDYHHLQPL